VGEVTPNVERPLPTSARDGAMTIAQVRDDDSLARARASNSRV